MAVISLPLTNWVFQGEIAVVMAFLAVFLVILIKRLTAQPANELVAISRKRLLLNRLLFDRDVMDRKFWMFRKPIDPQELFDDTE